MDNFLDVLRIAFPQAAIEEEEKHFSIEHRIPGYPSDKFVLVSGNIVQAANEEGAFVAIDYYSVDQRSNYTEVIETSNASWLTPENAISELRITLRKISDKFPFVDTPGGKDLFFALQVLAHTEPKYLREEIIGKILLAVQQDKRIFFAHRMILPTLTLMAGVSRLRIDEIQKQIEASSILSS